MNRPGFLPVDEYIEQPHGPSTWLVKDLIPMGGAGLIYGLQKTGKSAAAIQLACALSGGADDWLGFKISTHGTVLFLELDTPRSTWRLRFKALSKVGVKYSNSNLLIADRESLEYHPFDILQPMHMKYLYSLVQPIKPMVVIVDTLRKVHSGEEDSSSTMSNVVSSLQAAIHPAALILISHSRKPHVDAGHDLMSDHRGSGSVTAEMDAVMKMTKTKLFYGGRNIEEGDIRLERMETNDILLWRIRDDNEGELIQKVLCDTSLISMRAKARALGLLVGKGEEACMSIIRRTVSNGALVRGIPDTAGTSSESML